MKKQAILFTLLVGVIAVALAVVFVWNKPHKSVEGEKGLVITAEALAQAFENDEKAANDTYLSKILSVQGTVAEVTKNQDGKTVLLLSVENPLSGIQCTMKEAENSYQSGQNVTIKGFCNGYTMVVLLNDCVEVK